jgi:hypothetical protein
MVLIQLSTIFLYLRCTEMQQKKRMMLENIKPLSWYGSPVKNRLPYGKFGFALLTLIGLSPFSSSQQFKPTYDVWNVISPAVQVDLNADGIPDFIAQDRTVQSQQRELLSSGPGTFTSRTVSIPGFAGGFPIASGDFNADGKTDVVIIGDSLGVASGDGKGGFTSFQPISWSQTSFFSLQAVVADFNGDGKPDLSIAVDTAPDSSTPGRFQIVLFLKNSSGFAGAATIYKRQLPSNSFPGDSFITDLDLVLGDFDADGHADLSLRTIEHDPSATTPVMLINVLFGNGGGSFIRQTIANSIYKAEIAAADMNNDGASDIVATRDFATIIYYGHSSRSFTQTKLNPADNRRLTPMLADVNGNKRKDVVYPATPPGDLAGVSTLLQTLSGTFQQAAFEQIDTYITSNFNQRPFTQALVGDYNRDGKPDVALASSQDTLDHPSNLDVLLNTRAVPNGTCQAPAHVGVRACSPKAGQTLQSPVTFSFSANSFYPMRKMEVWIDGKKRSETYEVFANEGFANVKLTLAAGSHKVGLFASAFDGTVQHISYAIDVQ